MSCFCLSILNYCSTVLLGASYTNVDSQSTRESIIYSSETMDLVVPEKPLVRGSVQLRPRSDVSCFAEWTPNNSIDSYEIIQKIVRIWEKQGINDYLIYGKEADKFNWEIVPFEKKGWAFWKQFKVLWKTTFGSSCLSHAERQTVIRNFQAHEALFLEPLAAQVESITTVSAKKDAFCDPEVISKQRVFEGRHINVLYNYAPITIGEGKLHFLLVPKDHRARFDMLTKEEYLESVDLEKKLVRFYADKGYHTAYLFDKTGAEAGQTVPHWHRHLVFTATKTQEFFSRFVVLKNMIWGSSPLARSELEKRVGILQNNLREVLKPSE